MSRSRVIKCLAGFIAAAIALCGCSGSDAPVDEHKNPHFQRAVSYVNALDYKDAAEEFEQALEDNPRSGAAHFELACLYDTKLSDGAAAIYHYQRHLELVTNSPHRAEILERIRWCKQDLSKSEFLPPITQNLQRRVDELTAENVSLRDQVTALKRQNAIAAQELIQAGAVQGQVRARQNIPPPLTPIVARPKIHVVQEGETMSAIAAQYGIRTSALAAANPRINPKHLRIGQSLQLP